MVEIIARATPEQLEVLAKHRAGYIFISATTWPTRPLPAPEARGAASGPQGTRHPAPMAPASIWHEERPRSGRLADAAEGTMFVSCWVKRCVQALDGQIAICPKVSSGYELGMEEKTRRARGPAPGADTIACLLPKPLFDVCRGCARVDKEVLVVKQLRDESHAPADQRVPEPCPPVGHGKSPVQRDLNPSGIPCSATGTRRPLARPPGR